MGAEGAASGEDGEEELSGWKGDWSRALEEATSGPHLDMGCRSVNGISAVGELVGTSACPKEQPCQVPLGTPQPLTSFQPICDQCWAQTPPPLEL